MKAGYDVESYAEAFDKHNDFTGAVQPEGLAAEFRGICEDADEEILKLELKLGQYKTTHDTNLRLNSENNDLRLELSKAYDERNALKAIEWCDVQLYDDGISTPSMEAACPRCKYLEIQGCHAPNCIIGNALKKAERDELGSTTIQSDTDSHTKESEYGTKDVVLRLPNSTRSFRCHCGCNVFREFVKNMYRCNSCGETYMAEKEQDNSGERP